VMSWPAWGMMILVAIIVTAQVFRLKAEG
jgi:hypothetical protein